MPAPQAAAGAAGAGGRGANGRGAESGVRGAALGRARRGGGRVLTTLNVSERICNGVLKCLWDFFMCCPGVSVPEISFLLHEQYNYFGFALFFSYCCLKS